MESPKRDGQNKLAKTIKEENLKFSVEFEDGRTAGHKDNESVVESYQESYQAEYVSTADIRETETTVKKTADPPTTRRSRETISKKDEQSMDTNKYDIKETRHHSQKGATKRKIEDTSKQSKDLKLPPINDSQKSPRESKSFGSTRISG